MHKLEVNNLDGSFFSITQMANDLNIGESTVRKVAVESGAYIRIGRCFRVNREKFLEYLERGADKDE